MKRKIENMISELTGEYRHLVYYVLQKEVLRWQGNNHQNKGLGLEIQVPPCTSTREAKDSVLTEGRERKQCKLNTLVVSGKCHRQVRNQNLRKGTGLYQQKICKRIKTYMLSTP